MSRTPSARRSGVPTGPSPPWTTASSRRAGPSRCDSRPRALGKLPLALFTECGAIRLPRGNSGLESRMFHGSMGDTTSRSWHGFLSRQGENRLGDISALFERIPAAVRGDRRAPGIDIISRAGTVTYEPTAGAAAGR